MSVTFSIIRYRPMIPGSVESVTKSIGRHHPFQAMNI